MSASQLSVQTAMYRHGSISSLQNRVSVSHLVYERARQRSALDLPPLEDKENAKELVKHYCEFMSVLRESFLPNQYQDLSPPPMVDLVWHEHILDTKGYHQFCAAHFGDFVHHNANGSLPGNAPSRKIRQARTVQEYLKHLKEPRLKELIATGMCWSDLNDQPPQQKASMTVTAGGNASSAVERKRTRDTDGTSVCEKHAKKSSKSVFDVHVQTLTGATILVEHTSSEDRIQLVAESVHEKSGVPLDQMRLINRGRQVYGMKPVYGYAEADVIGLPSNDTGDLVSCIIGYVENPESSPTITLGELGIDRENNRVMMVLRLGGC
ncbi:hypothetical protein CYMTET_31835 [Cymbomonas tetramitiformis]|uniref:Ubiquitin-like domain-containing protein n=1 Tax=Cymbomonas tetramitiformis TaxID=36881 RepID=A0AAE0F622_9CHLO|nr:hypothetical protein CYMTET_38956 [Cymbomonas tetramitiformis]KAK3259175.1 hypothetical protein CYMTET_31835 [Cymbomonas tetramitiformis]